MLVFKVSLKFGGVMKFLLIFVLSFCSFMAQANKVIANYTYLKAKKPVKKSIYIADVRRAYATLKQSVFNPPKKEVFFNEYLRFKMGVELALNDRRLVKSSAIENMIVNPFFKEAFHQELYKALAELKFKRQMSQLDKKSANLSRSTLRRLYKENPEFNIFFISINHPINPSPKQINEARRRANMIHSQVIKSKKPFLELVALYSDDKSNGTLGINRSAASIPPAVYEKLKGMKNNSISRPIRVPFGYFIVRLNTRVPFSSANTVAIKANYFNKERTKLFNTFFDNIKKDFKLNINKALVKTL